MENTDAGLVNCGRAHSAVRGGGVSDVSDEAIDPSRVPGLEVLGDIVVISWFDKERYIDDVTLPLDVCATLLDIIDRYERDHAYEVALAILRMAHQNFLLTPVEAHRIKQSLWALDLNRGQIAARDELLVEYSYHALKNRNWTRADAAQFASLMLHKPVSTDAWRKRVDRWAKEQELPKVEIYKKKQEQADTEK